MSHPVLTTHICHASPDRVQVRDFDLADDLIGSTSTAEYLYVLLTGRRPRADQVEVLDACIVALAEHGLVPSVQAARMTYAASPESLHGAVAAGILGAGSVILGSSEEAGRLLADIVAAASDDDELASTALAQVRELRSARLPLPGFGHPVHRQRDPRADALLAVSDRLGTSGRHVAALRAVVAAVPAVYERHLPLNVSGAIPAVLLDVDFPVRALKAVALVGRTMSLVAHLIEEQDDPIGFGLAAAAEQAVTFEPGAPLGAAR
jgi:citrate synthase